MRIIIYIVAALLLLASTPYAWAEGHGTGPPKDDKADPGGSPPKDDKEGK